jgi:alanyl-tRNA synthetase
MIRIEQQDPYRTEFEAWLEAVERDERGTWWRLDRSAFYPTSGGQLHDTGELRAMDARWLVRDVELRDGCVWHLVRAPEDEPGGAAGGSGAAAPDAPARRRVREGAVVHGHVEWRRRFAHMQRHTAQHLLSQAFVRLGEAYATRSVGLSSPDATLDLAGEPDDEVVDAAERLVNEVAARALPIHAFEIREEELGRYPLRRPPKVRGRIRVVEMGTWERSACGGTHLRSTAEALPVLVAGSERVRGNLVRVTFRAGLEAVEHASATGRAARAAAVRLSAAVSDLPDRVAALQDEAAAARRLASLAQGDLAELLAAGLAPDPAARRVIVHRLADERAGLETLVADALARRGATAAIAAVDGTTVRLVLASGAGIDVRPALRVALAAIEGRGGGRPERAQGAGPGVDGVEAALEAARSALAAASGASPG